MWRAVKYLLGKQAQERVSLLTCELANPMTCKLVNLPTCQLVNLFNSSTQELKEEKIYKDMKDLKRNIAIVCGGNSSEHEVSLRSARGLYISSG